MRTSSACVSFSSCRSLDMALDEIRTLLRFRDAPEKNCGDVNALLDEHIDHVAQLDASPS